jgi:serine/threonine-protein kinase
MLDSRGRVRITDFGLAVAAHAAGLESAMSGTPAYMAPEQLAGTPASAASDIYALGLVLHELHTGKRAYPDGSFAELRTRKERESPPAPSEVIRDMDPAVERVIMRALARDPRARPSSVAEIAAALPRGNALEAALRAGETPSPEAVAASGTNEGLEPRVAWGLVALVVAGSVAAMTLGSKGLLWRLAAPEKSPEVLADHARELLAGLGYDGPAADRASGFEVDLDQLRYMQTRGPLRLGPNVTNPSFLRFWYRDSTQPLESWRFPFQYGNVSRITPADPPLDKAGMTLLRLDPARHVTQLVVVSSSATTDAAAPEADGTTLLTRFGFDAAAWQAATPARTPPVFADTRAAWQGTWPGRPDLPVRLEAASLRGHVVYFEAVFPWTPLPQTPPTVLTAGERAAVLLLFVVLGGTMVGIAIFAQRNVRAGRGDRRGALRVATFVFAAMIVSWFFGESHVATLWEIALVMMALSWALLVAAFCWLAYLAVEPFLRRRWPEVLVAWARLLAGEFRDPLVGRDLLVGCAAGPLLALVAIAGLLMPDWLGLQSDFAFADVYGFAYGVQGVIPLLVWRFAQGIIAGLGGVFLMLLLRLTLRSQHAAAIVFVVAGSVIAGMGLSNYWINFAVGVVHFSVFALLLVRCGLLAAVTQFYVWALFIFFPVTTDLSVWYAGASVTPLLVLAALTLFGFVTSLGGRPALGKVAIDR